MRISPSLVLLVLAVSTHVVMVIQSATMSSGDVFSRRLAFAVEKVPEEYRDDFRDMMMRSENIRRNIASLSSRLPHDEVSESIKHLNDELQIVTRSMVDMSRSAPRESHAAELAIERAQKRNSKIRYEMEMKRREEENLQYVQNMRKMQLVDNTVAELKHRAALHGLDNFDMKRVSELLYEYRNMEADYIFNGTNMLGAQTQKRFVEKFIGDSQAVEVTNKQRQKELLERTVQELAARGVSFMCRDEMKTLDAMLSTYRNQVLQLIELTYSKHSSEAQEVAAAQKASQAQKLMIEKFIGTTKRSSTCASAKHQNVRRT